MMRKYNGQESDLNPYALNQKKDGDEEKEANKDKKRWMLVSFDRTKEMIT